MKPNQEQIDDRLMDALLRHQTPEEQEQALLEIENALDVGPIPVAFPVASRWRSRIGIVAACVTIGCLVVLGYDAFEKNRKNSEMAQVAETRSKEIQERKNRQQELATLNKAVRDQEDKVEERRKVLATIVRTKGIIYKGQDSFYGQSGVDEDHAARSALAENLVSKDAIGRGLDAQDYVDAKRNFETDQGLLMDMKLREINMGIEERIALSDQVPKAGTNAGLSLLRPLPKTDKTASAPADSAGLAMNEEGKGALLERDVRPRVVPPPSSLAASSPNAEPVIAGNVNRFQADKVGVGFVLPSEEPAPAEKPNTERYGSLIDPKWQRPSDYPLSTFSIDVDNASYSNIRRFIRDGQNIPPDSVRIEECINAFDYNYAKPEGDKAFAVHTSLATCPWNEDHLLMKVGIKGREIPAEQRPVSNMVFLIDVSGSMQSANKLPLVKESLKVLLHQLDERDSVSYVVYAGGQGVVLPPTKMTESGRATALEALGKLEAGGSTNGGAGIRRAYQIAREMFIKDGVNRVILATDGDFNVGITDQSQLVQLVKERAADNIYLSVLGFGTGNLNDALMESISKDGNGNHYYIDSIREGRKVLLQRLSGTLITIAKDVKIQIEFNPSKVGSYRLIGYANRQLRDEDFNNDKVDAGDIGAGHTVTAFYEIVPAGKPQPNGGGVDALKYQPPAGEPVLTAAEPSDEWLTLKLRHKSPEGDISSLQESVVKGGPIRWQDADSDFSFASAVALFGMKLRGMDEARGISWERIGDLATPGLKNDLHENRAEFIGLLEALEKR